MSCSSLTKDECNQFTPSISDKETSTRLSMSENICFSDQIPPELIQLIKNGTLTKCMNNIRDSNQVDTFINLITVLADGQLKTSNIVWKSALYHGLWSSCGSTHHMRFDEEFVNFWSLIDIMFGASTLNVLRGPVYFSKVVEEVSAKNQYDPIRVGLVN